MIFVRRADSDFLENLTICGILGSYGPFNTNKNPLALGLTGAIGERLINPLTAKLFNLIFFPFEVVSR